MGSAARQGVRWVWGWASLAFLCCSRSMASVLQSHGRGRDQGSKRENNTWLSNLRGQCWVIQAQNTASNPALINKALAKGLRSQVSGAASFSIVSPPSLPVLIPRLCLGYTSTHHLQTLGQQAQIVQGEMENTPMSARDTIPARRSLMQRSKRIMPESLELQSREGNRVKGLKKFSIWP